LTENRSSYRTLSDDVKHQPKPIWSIQKSEQRNAENSQKKSSSSKISKYDVASLLLGPKKQNIIKPEVID